MTTFALLRDLIGMGGDTALIAVAWALWRFDRRLYRLEYHLFTHLKEHPK